MKQKGFILGMISLAMLPLATHAQIYQDASNSTATVVRDPARQASTEIDAVLFNPAGTAFLNDGWHLSLNGVLSSQRFNLGDSYHSIEKSMLNTIPSLQAAYKKGSLALSLSVANEGGYGTWARSEDALLTNLLTNAFNPTFETYKDVMSQYTNHCNLADQFLSKAMINGDLYNFSARVGAAYQLNPHWSVYAGVRLNYVTETTKVNLYRWVERANGSIDTPNQYFNAVNDEFQKTIQDKNDEVLGTDEALKEQLIGILGDMLNESMAEIPDYTPMLDTRTTGWGISPVIGVDYTFSNFNFAARYEFETKIHPKGHSSLSYHIPSLLSVGASWQINDNLKIAVGGNWHHLHKNTYGRKQSAAYSDPRTSIAAGLLAQKHSFTSGEYTASVSFSPVNRLLMSVGYTYSSAMLPTYKSFYAQSIPASNSISTHAVSGGLRYELNDNIQLDFGISNKMSMDVVGKQKFLMDNYQKLSMSAGITINI